MKKFLTSLLCVMMIVCYMPAMAWAEGDDEQTGTTYRVSTWNEFQQSLTESNEEDTIQLLNDIVIDDSALEDTKGNIYIRKNIVLDLNGKELKIGTNGTKNLYVYNGIKIINGSIKGKFYSYNNDVVMEDCNVKLEYNYSVAVTVSNASFTAKNCTIESTGTGGGCYAVVFTNGNNETLNLTDCKLESNLEGALNYCGSSNNAVIENCEIKSNTTSSSSGTLRIYSASGSNNLTVTNTVITNSGGGRAVYVQQDAGAVINFGEDNTVTGKVKLNGGANAYKFNVTGGQFKNGTEIPFECGDASLLNLTGGEFAADVDTLTAQGYTCEKAGNNAEYPYEVIAEGASAQPFYTQNEGVKTYYDTFEKAVSAVKGTADTIYLKQSVTINNAADLNGLTLKGRAGISVTYNGAIADFIQQAQNITISDASVSFSDVTMNSMTSVSGKLTGGKGLTSSNYQSCVPLLGENSLIDASSYEIKPAENYEAKIGTLGYTWLSSAIGAASSNDAGTPVNDEIVLLKSVSSYMQPVISLEPDSENAAFTVDFNGYNIETEVYNACVIINCSNVDITFKNGAITSNSNIAVATNGQRENISLKLENMNVKSGAGAALYLAGDGNTQIIGGAYEGVTGIEIRAGALNISENADIKGGTGELTVVPNSNGTTTSNAALAVAQHTTKKPISVIIENGTFTGSAAISEADPQANEPTDVTIEIKDGSFIGNVASEDCTKFISGGTYSVKPEIENIVDERIAIAYTSSDETNYYVGTPEQINEKAEDAKSGEKIEVFKGDIDLKVDASGVTVSNTGDGSVTVNDTKVEKDKTVTTGAAYVPSYPTIQKPVIEPNTDVTTSLSSDGTTLTIKANEGYEITDVTVNGVSKGAVDKLTGLKTGDKVVIKTQKVEKPDDNAALIEAVKSFKLVARSANAKAPSGKKAIKVTWFAKDGSELNFDGYEIYRSTKKNSGYGTKPIYKTTKSLQYFNTSAKKGTRYYYKVRGYKLIGGEKVYTQYSLKAIRTAK